MRNFIQPGGTLDLVAPSGGVTSGVGVLIGAIFAVASVDADEGETFAGAVRGVFELAATTHASTQAMSAGDPAYWDASTKKITKTASGNAMVAVVVEDKASTAATVKVAIVPRVAAAGTAIADLAGGADLPTTVTKVNAIISALEAAGVIKA